MEAGGRTQKIPTVDETPYIFGDPPPTTFFENDIQDRGAFQTAEAIKTQIVNEFGNGTRGHLSVAWTSGGAHSLIWECENNNVVIIDAQTNERHILYEITKNALWVDYFRTDDVPTENIVIKDISILNRKD